MTKIDLTMLLRVIVGVLLAVMGYFGKLTVVQLTQIQKDLTSIKLELVKVQSSIVTEANIRMIVKDELYERGIK